jgi:hypothetical protein
MGVWLIPSLFLEPTEREEGTTTSVWQKDMREEKEQLHRKALISQSIE